MSRPLILLLLAMLTCSVANAQQESGDVELGVQGFFSTTVGTDNPTSSGNILGKLGFFLSDHLELGFGPSVTFSTIRNSKGQTELGSDFGSSAFLTYSLIARTKTVPYLGIQYYKMSFANDNDKGSFGINGGIKFFFSSNAAFDISGNYLTSLNEGHEVRFFNLAFGVSVVL